jgi:hypothetical protein
MEPQTLSGLLKQAAAAGAYSVLAEHNLFPEELTLSQAYRKYGRSSVDRWIKEKLIVFPAKNGQSFPKKLNTRQLEAIAAKSNRATYLPWAER